MILASLRSIAALSFALLFVVAWAGCGPKEPKLDLVPVTGTVKLKGTPLAGANVSFNVDGPTTPEYVGSAAVTDASGKYELLTNSQKGAVAGKFKVSVSKYTDKSGNVPKVDPEAGMDLEQMIQGGSVVQAVPAPYDNPATTQKTVEVVAGKENVIDIDIP